MPSTRSRSSSSPSSSNTSTSSLDIFESALTLLGSLPVARTSSGKERPIIHTSDRFGELKLYLPDVEGEDERMLQSHLLWPAGVRMAECLQKGQIEVENETILELGAGAALPSLTATLCGARKVVITDFPAPGILKAIRRNVDANLPSEKRELVAVAGLDWVDAQAVLANIKNDHAPNGFSRILAADTLWISSMHFAQLDCITALLSPTSNARVHIVAGLHSGRPCVRSFLRQARQRGLSILSARETDRKGELDDLVWTANTMESDAGDGTTEEERRRWLLEVELAWSDMHLAAMSPHGTAGKSGSPRNRSLDG